MHPPVQLSGHTRPCGARRVHQKRAAGFFSIGREAIRGRAFAENSPRPRGRNPLQRPERGRPDGAIVRRWTRARYDAEEQVEHTEDRYEVVVDGEIVQAELFSRSPATRWYTQEQSRKLFEEAGFTDLKLFRKATRQVAIARNPVWTLVATRP